MRKEQEEKTYENIISIYMSYSQLKIKHYAEF